MIHTVKFTPTEKAAVNRRMDAYNTLVSTIAEVRGLVGGRIEILPDGSGFKFNDGIEEVADESRSSDQPAA